MSDERPHRSRRHDFGDAPTDSLNLERMRYFTQPSEGKPTTRHRRRRVDASETGGQPVVPPPARPVRQETSAPAAPAVPAPATPVAPVAPEVPATPETSREPAVRRSVTARRPVAASRDDEARPDVGSPDETAAALDETTRSRGEATVAPEVTVTPEATAAPEVAVAREATVARDDTAIRAAADASGEYADPLRRAVPRRTPPRRRPPVPGESAGRSRAQPVFLAPTAEAHDGAPTATLTRDDESVPAGEETTREEDLAPARGRARRRSTAPHHRRRRVVLAVTIVCLLALVGGVGYYGLSKLGVFDNDKDYTNAAGTGDVIVDIPQNSTLRDFGRILEQKDVVGSAKAFVNAADGQAMSGGYYKLRTQIPAATAVAMMSGTENRVGRMVVPEGLQLDSKQGIDGKTTPGIFEMIANATEVTINGQRIGSSIADLEKVAATATPDQLGVPEWARAAVTELTGDHRRIEGLIAPGTWETIDPSQSTIQILHQLITDSAARFEQWGLLGQHSSGLTPYQTLTAASVVEREVTNADDYPKVARVILNRLDKGQRLEMDSTANYTARITNIDVHGESYTADNKWNTYQVQGLPVTPIGAVGERALEAAENPATGKWLYFVTVDRNGTTLFADDFEDHKRNREKACENKLLTTGCD